MIGQTLRRRERRCAGPHRGRSDWLTTATARMLQLCGVARWCRGTGWRAPADLQPGRRDTYILCVPLTQYMCVGSQAAMRLKTWQLEVRREFVAGQHRRWGLCFAQWVMRFSIQRQIRHSGVACPVVLARGSHELVRNAKHDAQDHEGVGSGNGPEAASEICLDAVLISYMRYQLADKPQSVQGSGSERKLKRVRRRSKGSSLIQCNVASPA